MNASFDKRSKEISIKQRVYGVTVRNLTVLKFVINVSNIYIYSSYIYRKIFIVEI